MDWFEELYGFKEEGSETVYRNLSLVGEDILSAVNGKRYRCGRLQIISLAELRKTHVIYGDNMTVEVVLGDLRDFHCLPESEGALIQAAS